MFNEWSVYLLMLGLAWGWMLNEHKRKIAYWWRENWPGVLVVGFIILQFSAIIGVFGFSHFNMSLPVYVCTGITICCLPVDLWILWILRKPEREK